MTNTALNKKYQIIYADMPWPYDNMKNNDPKMGGFSYGSMTIEEMCALKVKDITDKDCSLFMWCTWPKLFEAKAVIDAWGFKYTTCAFVWVKLNPTGSMIKETKDIILKKGVYSGLGHWVNGNTEFCLFCKKGTPKRVNKDVKQLIFSPRGRHSEKPAEVRDRIINLVGDLPKIELCARQRVEGWDAWGKEIGYDIEL